MARANRSRWKPSPASTGPTAAGCGSRAATSLRCRRSGAKSALWCRTSACFLTSTLRRTWRSRGGAIKDGPGTSALPLPGDPAALLGHFGVAHLARRLPADLSPGEKQRVALARAIGRRAGPVPVRRAVLRARRPDPRRASRRAEVVPARAFDPGDLCHPRPHRGADAGRPNRGVAWRRHAAKRVGGRSLSKTRQFRGRALHRCGEYPRRPHRRDRRRDSRGCRRRADAARGGAGGAGGRRDGGALEHPRRGRGYCCRPQKPGHRHPSAIA